MANIKSAKKRISTIQRRREENKFVKATISTLTKKFRKMLEESQEIPSEETDEVEETESTDENV